MVFRCPRPPPAPAATPRAAAAQRPERGADSLGDRLQYSLNNAGQRTQGQVFDADGNTVSQTVHGDTFSYTYNLRFPGQYVDQASGLIHNGQGSMIVWIG